MTDNQRRHNFDRRTLFVDTYLSFGVMIGLIQMVPLQLNIFLKFLLIRIDGSYQEPGNKETSLNKNQLRLG